MILTFSALMLWAANEPCLALGIVSTWPLVLLAIPINPLAAAGIHDATVTPQPVLHTQVLNM